MTSERDKLIEELQKERDRTGGFYTLEDIADFVLADRKRIVDPLNNHLTYFDDCHYCNKMADAINKTLTNAGLFNEGAPNANRP